MKIIIKESQLRLISRMILEQIDTDDEENELRNLYHGRGEYDYDLDDMDSDREFSSEFSDPDEYEDLHDLSVAKRNLPRDKRLHIHEPSKDMGYKGSKHFDIAGSGAYGGDPKLPKNAGDEFLRKYGTPDPNPDYKTLADVNKDKPLKWPKITKTKYDHENKLSWAEKKALMADREEKRIARELAKERRLEKMRDMEKQSFKPINKDDYKFGK
jgi:hypothetical protein